MPDTVFTALLPSPATYSYAGAGYFLRRCRQPSVLYVAADSPVTMPALWLPAAPVYFARLYGSASKHRALPHHSWFASCRLSPTCGFDWHRTAGSRLFTLFAFLYLPAWHLCPHRFSSALSPCSGFGSSPHSYAAAPRLTPSSGFGPRVPFLPLLWFPSLPLLPCNIMARCNMDALHTCRTAYWLTAAHTPLRWLPDFTVHVAALRTLLFQRANGFCVLVLFLPSACTAVARARARTRCLALYPDASAVA